MAGTDATKERQELIPQSWIKERGGLCNQAASTLTHSVETKRDGQKLLWAEGRPVVVCTKRCEQLGGE